VGNGISFEYGYCSHNNVSGNTISNFLNGILFNDKSDYNSVEGNTVKCTGLNGAGIYATDKSSNMKIVGNTVSGAEDGIAVQQIGTSTATNYIISSNTLNGNKNGLWIRIDNSTVSNNLASSNIMSGIDITGKYNNILDNAASYNGNCGITLTGVCYNDYNVICRNVLNNNMAGINSASQHSSYSNNTVTCNTNNGMILTADHSTVTCNRVNNNGESGVLCIGLFNLIKSNQISGNNLGIYIQNVSASDHNTVSYNNVTNNKNGINSASPYTQFDHNNINTNTQNGLINTASFVIIDSNIINGNLQNGILSIGSNVSILNNQISSNDLGICLQKLTQADNNSASYNNVTNNKNGINSASPYTQFDHNNINSNTQNGLTNTADHVSIYSNVIKNNKCCGILSIGIYNSLISNNISGNDLGICLQNSSYADNNYIKSNTVNYNKNGINSACSYSTISSNNLNYNNDTGLTVTGSWCLINGNSMSNNKVAGLTITGTYNNVTQNLIYNNLYGASFSSALAAVFNFNCVVGNTYQLYQPSNEGALLDAQLNWWGSNSNPTNIYGAFNYSRWLILKLTAVKSQVVGTSSTVVADLNHDCQGVDVSQLGHLKNGLTIYFLSTLGTISSKVAIVNGSATTCFKAVTPGTAKISTVLDLQKTPRYISVFSAIRSVNLSNNAVRVSTNKTIQLTYNIPIKFGKNIFIELKSSNGRSVSIKPSIKSNVLTISHTTLSKGTKYILVIHTGTITDLKNKSMPLYTLNFTTAK
jgi:hypothetical protein